MNKRLVQIIDGDDNEFIGLLSIDKSFTEKVDYVNMWHEYVIDANEDEDSLECIGVDGFVNWLNAKFGLYFDREFVDEIYV